LGAFLNNFKSEAFFQTVPLEILAYDMNSMSYANDSKSYLLPILKRHLKKDSLMFFTSCYLPLLTNLDDLHD